MSAWLGLPLFWRALKHKIWKISCGLKLCSLRAKPPRLCRIGRGYVCDITSCKTRIYKEFPCRFQSSSPAVLSSAVPFSKCPGAPFRSLGSSCLLSPLLTSMLTGYFTLVWGQGGPHFLSPSMSSSCNWILQGFPSWWLTGLPWVLLLSLLLWMTMIMKVMNRKRRWQRDDRQRHFEK